MAKTIDSAIYICYNAIMNETNIQDAEDLIDRLTYWIGYARGSANMLRSASSIDPLIFGSEFESLARDFSIMKEILIQLLYDEDENEEEIQDEDNKKK